MKLALQVCKLRRFNSPKEIQKEKKVQNTRRNVYGLYDAFLHAEQ